MLDEAPDKNLEQSSVEVRRSFRVVGFLARYLVFIDGVVVGQTKTGSFVKFSVPAGSHEIQIWNRAMRMCSDSVAIELTAGQTVSFVCRSNPGAVLGLSFSFPRGPSRYMDSMREVRRDGCVVKGGIALSMAPKNILS